MRLLGCILLPHNENGESEKECERSRSGPKQPANCPPGGTLASLLSKRLDIFARDSLAELMAEELFICHHVRAEFAFQESAELFRIALFQFSCSFVGQRSLELDQLFSSELTVEPGRPFFFKCFHKRPSINFAISCARKTSATSLCQSNSRAFLQSRDIASPQSPSLRSQRDGRAKVARLRCQCASGFQTAPLSRRATRPLSALF